jgi:hypothetical protein
MTTFYCLRFETPPTWRARSQYLYHPGTGWPGYTHRHWVPFSSPLTTRSPALEVFDPASTRDDRPHSSWFSLHRLSIERIENTVSNNFSVSCSFGTAEMCLSCRCLAMNQVCYVFAQPLLRNGCLFRLSCRNIWKTSRKETTSKA